MVGGSGDRLSEFGDGVDRQSEINAPSPAVSCRSHYRLVRLAAALIVIDQELAVVALIVIVQQLFVRRYRRGDVALRD